MEYGTYIFFAFWVFLMTLYVIFFLPETQGVPIEEMGILWRKHWFWGKVVMAPEQRAAFQKGDLLRAGVTTGDITPVHVPRNMGSARTGQGVQMTSTTPTGTILASTSHSPATGPSNNPAFAGQSTTAKH